MIDRQMFYLISDRVRDNAVSAVRSAPIGSVVAVGPEKRSLNQNAFFHSICSDIAKAGMKWAGKERDATEWKTLLVSGHTKATDGEVEFVPGLEGEFVNIRESTARMSVKRANSLIDYCLAFCGEHGIELRDTMRNGFIDERHVA